MLESGKLGKLCPLVSQTTDGSPPLPIVANLTNETHSISPKKNLKKKKSKKKYPARSRPENWENYVPWSPKRRMGRLHSPL